MTSEILFTEETDYIKNQEAYGGFDFARPDMQIARYKTTVFGSPDKVSVVQSAFLTGKNKASDKRWYKWKAYSANGFYRTSTGLIQPFAMTRTMNATERTGWRNVVASQPVNTLGAHLNEQNRYRAGWGAIEAFSRGSERFLGLTSLPDLYPMTHHYGLSHYLQMPYSLRKAFRNEEIRPFTEEVFGKSRYRRDLLKATRDATPTAIAIAREFRGLTPPDWIVDFLRMNPEVTFGDAYGSSINLRHIILKSNPKSYRSLLRRQITQRDIMAISNLSFRRAPGFVWDIPAENPFRSFEQMHNDIFRGRYGMNHYSAPFVDSEIALTPLAEKLDNLPAGNLLITPAKHTSIMTEWGNKMSNCIASYRSTALAGSGVYAGVMDGETLVANLEVRDNRLVQLLGRFNQSLPDDRRSAVVRALESVGVDTSRDWWGKSDL